MTTGAGPRPWWNGVGFGLAMAVVIAFLVVLYVPPSPVPDDDGAPPTTTGRTITLDELEAMLTNDAPQAPPVVVETPDGPATVVVPAQPPASPPPTTTSTTSTTTTTAPPLVDRPHVPSTDGLLDDILGEQTPTTTIPEGVDGDP